MIATFGKKKLDASVMLISLARLRPLAFFALLCGVWANAAVGMAVEVLSAQKKTELVSQFIYLLFFLFLTYLVA